MNDWKKYKLGEIAELRKEQVASNGVEQPYIGLEHIEQQSLRLNGIGSSDSVVSNKFKFYEGDILYGRLRPYFRKVYNPKFEGVCSTEIFVIKNKKNVDKDFLFYLVATEEFTNISNSGSSGTHMPRADWRQLVKSEWNIPDVPTQKEIAQILSSLDDKIELNLQMNQTLEAIAQAIFKEWFVDFNFPVAPQPPKGGESYKSTLGDLEASISVARVLNSANKYLYPQLKEKAKEMRNNPTPCEKILWNELQNKKLGYKFRRQHVIDKFIVDFFCIEKSLIIEVDGEIHNNQIERDEERDDILRGLGCYIIRFKNEEVIDNLSSVLKKILTFLASRTSSSPHIEDQEATPWTAP
ncbi:MAG: DUF559 domain-containing protein, partial [Candidatus Cloacimonetes bacterium]|nr:DUF559 domain-containing protein [Candidatus Cloacimonadota bacterium]